MLHLVVCIDHVIFCAIDIFTQFFDANILSFDLFVKVLSLVLSCLNHTNYFVELVILISDLLLL